MPKVYVLYNQPSKDDEDEDWSCRNWTEYLCLSIFIWIILLGIVGVMTYFITVKRKGFAWDDNKTEEIFNIHPFLMIMGFIILEGISISLYRICRCCRRINVKLIHFILHIMVIPCAIGGYLSIDAYSAKQTNKRKYSAHSWVGMLTVGFFLLQFIIGFFTFVVLTCCNRATGSFRADMVPLHATFGVLNFAISVAAVATGIQEKFFKEKDGKGEGLEDNDMIYIRLVFLLIFALLIVVHYILRREELRYRAHLPNIQEEN